MHSGEVGYDKLPSLASAPRQAKGKKCYSLKRFLPLLYLAIERNGLTFFTSFCLKVRIYLFYLSIILILNLMIGPQLQLRDGYSV